MFVVSPCKRSCTGQHRPAIQPGASLRRLLLRVAESARHPWPGTSPNERDCPFGADESASAADLARGGGKRGEYNLQLGRRFGRNSADELRERSPARDARGPGTVSSRTSCASDRCAACPRAVEKATVLDASTLVGKPARVEKTDRRLADQRKDELAAARTERCTAVTEL